MKSIASKFYMILGMFLLSSLIILAQNKDIEKGKQLIEKAMNEKDNAKRGEMISKARELLMKGGMKSPEIAELLGNAYLAKRDYTNAANSFGAASKEARKVGYKQIAYLQLEDAFAATDPKTESKTLRSAISFFTKAEAFKEGARAIGDKYYDKGDLDKALEYYLQADAKDKIEKVASDYKNKGDDIKAAETYLQLKNETGYQAAGDIYFSKKNYEKAFDAYYAGNITSGLKRYADELAAQGKKQEAEQMYVKVAEAYINKDDKATVIKMAEEQVKKSNFALAATFYDKAGEDLKASKYKAYTKLMNFEFDEAKTLLEANGEVSLAKAVTANLKFLTPLATSAYNLDEIKRNEPKVDYETDANGNKVPVKADLKALEDYYKNTKGSITDELYRVSSNITKITDPELKNLMRLRFLQYKATSNILNPETFSIKLQKPQVSFKDAML
ncbi:MAG: hypothetical protein RMJ53_10545 [Chitinophagales bacterium]|nr:hypothetical protein [Chitinophagales bacterium]